MDLLPTWLPRNYKKTHPELKDVPLHYKYLSRKVVRHATDPSIDTNLTERQSQLHDYVFSDGLKPDSKMLLVDVGFMGSMINKLKEEFFPIKEPKEKSLEQNKAYRAAMVKYYTKVMGNPPTKSLSLNEMKKQILEHQYKFNFLVSHTEKAEGFMGNIDHELKSIISAGQNRAVHWIEDTHQGVINSPKKLIRLEDGTVVPDVLIDPGHPKTNKESRPGEYLIKSVATQAILDYVRGDVVADSFEAALAKERIDFFAELESHAIVPSLKGSKALLSKILIFFSKTDRKEISENQLNAINYLLQGIQNNYIERRVDKSSLKYQLVKKLLFQVTEEINMRDNTNYAPGVIATGKMQEIFDKYLGKFRSGGRFLAVEH